MSENIKQETNKTKQVDPAKKQKLIRIFTFIGGGVGIIALVLFAVIALRGSEFVYFDDGVEDKTVIITNMPSKKGIQIPDSLKIEEPEEPVRPGYDFLGWFIEGSDTPVDFETEEFGTDQKEFKWFGNVKKLPSTVTLYAKWAPHKFMVEVIDADTLEPVVIQKGEEEIKEFYVYALLSSDDYDDLLDAYVKIMAESDAEISVEEATKKFENLAKGQLISFENVWNIQYVLDSSEDVTLTVGEDPDSGIGDINRADLFGEDGKPKEITIKIYVHGLNN